MIERETQTIEERDPCTIVPAVDVLRAAGWRLVQIMAVSQADHTELNYSFGLGMQYKIIRLRVDPGVEVPSITSVFVAAYLYENEIRDLFGIKIERIAVDWLGKVYDVVEDKKFSKLTVTATSSEGGPR
ncbi:MAG TPA: NADH-quinone oxidoreductase subunit C [Rectinemataceae bacterium]|nr:NADH-quinone oxidoreductase subunit C [Rectinemataceae bacterium]